MLAIGPQSTDGKSVQGRNHVDGTDLPKKVLYPPESLRLKWNHAHCIGAGLENTGNNCFLNSALQCLTYTPPLANYMLTQEHSKTCHGLISCMMCTMEKHITQVLANSGDVIVPGDVIKVLQMIGQQFCLGTQEDAHEFLQATLNAMEQSCLQGTIMNRESQLTSIIQQVFGGNLRSRVHCLSCKAVSDTYEYFLDIPLEIETVASVFNALSKFVKPEQLGGENAYKCSRCTNMVTASKRFTIDQCPNVLTLTLKRFDIFSGGKIRKIVKYPEVLDLQSFMSEYKGKPRLYMLYAVLVHSGQNSHSGHYFCYIKSSDSQWFKMNDSIVTVTDIRSVLKQQAYILFYIKCDDMEEPKDYHSMNRNPDMNRSCYSRDDGFIGPEPPSYMTKNTLNGNDKRALGDNGMWMSSISLSDYQSTMIQNHNEFQRLPLQLSSASSSSRLTCGDLKFSHNLHFRDPAKKETSSPVWMAAPAPNGEHGYCRRIADHLSMERDGSSDMCCFKKNKWTEKSEDGDRHHESRFSHVDSDQACKMDMKRRRKILKTSHHTVF